MSLMTSRAMSACARTRGGRDWNYGMNYAMR